MTTISLCVIAQDKAPTLPDCIRSTSGVVDEVIVLDTGRLNGAGDWAVSNGAKMIPYQWAGDLAEARTAAIRHATGDWVLILDADEQLADGAGEVGVVRKRQAIVANVLGVVFRLRHGSNRHGFDGVFFRSACRRSEQVAQQRFAVSRCGLGHLVAKPTNKHAQLT